MVESRRVQWDLNITHDEIIRLTGAGADEKYPELLRRVVLWVPEEKRYYEFLTNHLKLAATTIARIYKERWQTEIFFKALKQNLKIKTFVGTSANAVKIQIWTALNSDSKNGNLILKARF